MRRSGDRYRVPALAATIFALIGATGQRARADDLNALSQDDKQWVMAPKNYANTRYSGLDQINAGNVANLHVAWTFSVGADRGQEAAPLVVDGTMYVMGPYVLPNPNQVFALDAATGDLKWSYTPKPNLSAMGVACCDVVTRGIAYDNGKIFLATLDMNAVAIDAKTGKEVWHTSLGNINKGETITMAPLAVKGKILIGNSGGEMGVRGWLTAVDENNGNIAWRAYATGPDKDVLIGQDFKPYYDWLKGQDLGVKSWPPDAWKIGGGTFWGWISIRSEPQFDLLRHGKCRALEPGTSGRVTISGRRRYSPAIPTPAWPNGPISSIPHDLWDYDEINESLVLDLPINGQTRKVLVHVARNGHMYVIDRTTGEILSADPYDTVNATNGIDLKTGRPNENEALKPAVGKTIVGVCPAAPGSQGLAAHRLFTAHQADLCAAPASVHELEIDGGRLHRRDALCRSHCRHVCRTGRLSRRVHGVGPGRPEKGLGDPREFPGVERHSGDGWRCHVLWNDGPLVQGRRCEERQGPLAVQGAVRDHRAADHLYGQ